MRLVGKHCFAHKKAGSSPTPHIEKEITQDSSLWNAMDTITIRKCH